MKTIFIILLAISLTSCLCSKHQGATVIDKIKGQRYKTELYTDNKSLHTFNYIVLKEQDSSITMKKMSKLRLYFHSINDTLGIFNLKCRKIDNCIAKLDTIMLDL